MWAPRGQIRIGMTGENQRGREQPYLHQNWGPWIQSPRLLHWEVVSNEVDVLQMGDSAARVWCGGDGVDFGVKQCWVWVPPWPLTGCVTFGNLFNLFKTPFLYLSKGGKSRTVFLNFGPIDMRDWIILCCVGCPALKAVEQYSWPLPTRC